MSMWTKRTRRQFRSATLDCWLVWFRQVPRANTLQLEIEFDTEEQLLEFERQYLRDVGAAGEEAGHD